MPNSSIKKEQMYEDLRKQGDSKEKAARISNAAAARGKSAVGRKGGRSGSYDDWTVAELKKRQGTRGVGVLRADQEQADLKNPQSLIRSTVDVDHPERDQQWDESKARRAVARSNGRAAK
jgi:hypothetical protein